MTKREVASDFTGHRSHEWRCGRLGDARHCRSCLQLEDDPKALVECVPLNVIA